MITAVSIFDFSFLRRCRLLIDFEVAPAISLIDFDTPLPHHDAIRLPANGFMPFFVAYY